MMHYVNKNKNFLLEYLVYHVHPFGYEQNTTEVLPKKLSLDEIIERSDAKSYAPEYKEHERIHNIEESERY